MADKKPYLVTFRADLTEADIRALNKYFYEAMDEALCINDVWGLDIVKA